METERIGGHLGWELGGRTDSPKGMLVGMEILRNWIGVVVTQLSKFTVSH